MKIIAFSAYLAIASAPAVAAASPFQLAQPQRLRGNQETRKLEECVPPERSLINETYCNATTTGQAYKPTSNHPDFTIDGTFAPWGDDPTCGIPMWEAGESSKVVVRSRAFLNWDCNTGALCILVNATDGHYLDPDPDNSNNWFKVYTENSNQVPIGDGLQTILDDTGNNILAWEACYDMNTTCFQQVQIHANFHEAGGDHGRTTSTGKKSRNTDATIALDLYCPCDQDVDCEIDACFSPSTCVNKPGIDGTDVGVCAFSVVVPPNATCCVDDVGCDEGATCRITGTAQTGECQYPSPTPATPEGPTSPSPTAEGSSPGSEGSPVVDLCTADTVATDCGIGDAHEFCAYAVCNILDSGNTCGRMANNTDLPCDMDKESERGNTCYQPICDGIYCEDSYLNVNATCDVPDDCNEYKCLADKDTYSSTKRTECKPVPKPEGTQCGSRPNGGLCDRGDRCDGKGSCSTELSFEPNTVVCRSSSNGQLCDAPEYCTGSDYECPEDKNYGDDDVVGTGGTLLTDAHVCRSSGRCGSTDCSDDVEEVCPGGTSACPPDIIFQKDFKIIAAQHDEAGITTVNVTDLGHGSVLVCVNITLNDEWELSSSSDTPIKYDIQTDGVPKSSPGSYLNKFLDFDEQAEKSCFTKVVSPTPTTMYFVLHLDVERVNDATNTGETAWAHFETDDDDASTSTEIASTTTTSTLKEWEFTKKVTKNGPRVSLSSTSSGDGVGWGKYYSFSLDCANVNVIEACATTEGGGGDDTTGTGGGTETTSPTYTCSSDDGTTLTCQHDASETEVGCHTLTLFN